MRSLQAKVVFEMSCFSVDTGWHSTSLLINSVIHRLEFCLLLLTRSAKQTVTF